MPRVQIGQDDNDRREFAGILPKPVNLPILLEAISAACRSQS
jgi:hypothetical protein